MIQSQSSNAIGLRGFTLRGAVLGIFNALLRWQDRARDRYRLAEMDEATRKDIGLTEAEIYQEYSKPFWRR